MEVIQWETNKDLTSISGNKISKGSNVVIHESWLNKSTNDIYVSISYNNVYITTSVSNINIKLFEV